MAMQCMTGRATRYVITGHCIANGNNIRSAMQRAVLGQRMALCAYGAMGMRYYCGTEVPNTAY
eukprot:470973-Rhodomonas_salina.2